MTQVSLSLDGILLGACALEPTARQHARKHGLTFLRCELERGLFGPVEVAVFRHGDGGLLRRTADMIKQAREA